MFRLDRQGAEPEFYDTQAAAERREWALVHMAGEKRAVLIWEDLATYWPVEEAS